MTLDEAKNLKQGQIVYHRVLVNKDDTPMRAKVLSVKTWKTRPENVLVSVKHGLYDYVKFNQNSIHIISVTPDHH